MFHVKQFADIGISLDNHQIEQFNQFYFDVIDKNQSMNLTAIIEEEEFLYKHYIDSLLIIKAYENVSRETFSVIDIGTGAGFPGIPLAIAFKNLNLTLIDSLDKRIKFLNEEIEKLGLKNARAIHGRAEDLAHSDDHREKYDLAVSRAVANLSTLTEYSLPFVHISGGFLPYKSGDAEVEIKDAEHAINELGGELKTLVKYSLPGNYGSRIIGVIEKVKHTPERYPRKAGTPSKKPL